jgi:hypothetical protein
MKKLVGLRCVWFIVAIFFLSWNNLDLARAVPPPQSLLGMSLQAAKETDFFTFFHFTETWREKDSAKRNVVIFKPDSPAFSKLVTLRTTLDSQDRIVQMELDLARAFIDSQQRAFANDIAGHLLANGLPRQDLITIKTLAQEIGYRAR